MYTIEDLSEGKVALLNDSTPEELREVLQAAFPDDVCLIRGSAKYYYRECKKYQRYWFSTDKLPTLPIQSVRLFLGKKDKIQLLTLKQLKQAHRDMSCEEIRDKIQKYLTNYLLVLDDEKIPIMDVDVKDIFLRGSTDQKEYFIKLGLRNTEDDKYFDLYKLTDSYNTIFDRNKSKDAGFNGNSFMQIISGDYEVNGKGFYLTGFCDWEFKKVGNHYHLIPTKKS